jgi:arabinose-5-phosphate isomerase
VEREADPSGLIPTASSTAALAIGDALAIALMKKKGISEQDFAFFHPKGQLGRKLLKIKSLMHKGRRVPSVPLSTPMKSILEEMSQKGMGMTCVTDNNNKLVGIITDGDLRRQLQKFGKIILNKKAQECMTPNPLAIDKEELATKALHIMETKKVTSLIVKNKDNEIEGIIHLHDLWGTEMF